MEIGLGIVQKENLFLLIERFQQEGDLLWAFPGGKKESYDSGIESTITREVFEETGIVCKPVRNFGQKDSGIIINYFLCVYQYGKSTPKIDEIKQCDWYSSKKIFNLVTSEIFPPVRKYLNKYL